MVIVFLAIIKTNSRNEKTNKLNFEIQSNHTEYNPATELPMMPPGRDPGKKGSCLTFNLKNSVRMK
ncbi:hypothetical protein DGG96_09030 [Legionella qingyii]|uniref:Uncharacterized protein n=1 Tax=Legionella qingyii TaxID=2184757 RepID=A0A317U3W5_9GAMM|nr:hypothetical protein DGG96_09030 [Legionella qingyii]